MILGKFRMNGWGSAFLGFAAIAVVTAVAVNTRDADPARADAEALDYRAITFGEYEEAVLRTASCAAARGVAIELEPGEGLRATSIGFSAPTLEQADEGRKILGECRAEHLVDIQKQYLERAIPTDAHIVGDQYVRDCLAEQHIRVEGSNLTVAILEHPDMVVREAGSFCFDRRRVELGF